MGFFNIGGEKHTIHCGPFGSQQGEYGGLSAAEQAASEASLANKTYTYTVKCPKGREVSAFRNGKRV